MRNKRMKRKAGYLLPCLEDMQVNKIINMYGAGLNEKVCALAVTIAIMLSIMVGVFVFLKKYQLCVTTFLITIFDIITFRMLDSGRLYLSRDSLEGRNLVDGGYFFFIFLIIHLCYLSYMMYKLFDGLSNFAEKYLPTGWKRPARATWWILFGFTMIGVTFCSFRFISVYFVLPLSKLSLMKVSCAGGIFSMWMRMTLQRGIRNLIFIEDDIQEDYFELEDYEDYEFKIPGMTRLCKNISSNGNCKTGHYGDTQRSKKNYFERSVSDLTINGNHLWDLSYGNVRQKICRGIKFLEVFHNVRIGSECLEEVMKYGGNGIIPINRTRFVLDRLHEACKLEARENELLKRYYTVEQELACLREEEDLLKEADIKIAIEREKSVQARIKEIEIIMEQIEQEFPVELAVEKVKRVIT